jgi:hypothetical protein
VRGKILNSEKSLALAIRILKKYKGCYPEEKVGNYVQSFIPQYILPMKA